MELIPLGQQFIAFGVQSVALAGQWNALRVDLPVDCKARLGEAPGARAPSAATALDARAARWR